MKEKILWHFNNQEIGIPPYMTSMFNDSNLEHVDKFCESVDSGEWKVKIMSMGTVNWYWEFKDYLKSVGVTNIFK